MKVPANTEVFVHKSRCKWCGHRVRDELGRYCAGSVCVRHMDVENAIHRHYAGGLRVV